MTKIERHYEKGLSHLAAEAAFKALMRREDLEGWTI
jgi:hypothetical protein